MEQKKKCRYCGAELPASADFCPVCAKSQADKQVMTAPGRRWKRPLTAVLTIVLVLAVVGVSVWQMQRLRQSSGGMRYEGDAQIYYTDADGSYNLFLMLNARNPARPESETHAELRTGESAASPSQLWIEPEEGAGSQEEFLARVDSYSVQTVPLDGAQAMDYSLPKPNRDFPGAALVSDIYYTADCGTNEVVWTLNMKNGDVICLTQRVVTSLMDTLVYDSSNAKLETAEDLQALLNQVNSEAGENTVVEIYLPPVTYEGDWELTGRGINLFGSSEGDKQTTFMKRSAMWLKPVL